MKIRRVDPYAKHSTPVFCYLDILGFSRFVENSSGPAPVLAVFQSIDLNVQAEFGGVEIHRRIVSDSILLWSADERALFPIINICALLQCSLLKLGFLMKGAISRGDHWETQFVELDPPRGFRPTGEEVWVSKPLVQAAKLEKGLKAPVVLIDEHAGSLLDLNKRAWPWFKELYGAVADGRREISRHFHCSEVSALLGELPIRPGDTMDPNKYISANVEPAILELANIRSTISSAILKGGQGAKYWYWIAGSFDNLLATIQRNNLARPRVIEATNSFRFGLEHHR